ncbi:MAG: GspMb/PilO family protein [Blastocatellia bacterium]|nr:GspMb/PilO family protein [Blastocatellia bacterium]
MNLRQNINLKDFFGGLGDSLRRARLSPIEMTFLIAALAFVAIVAVFHIYKVRPLGESLATAKSKEQELLTRFNKLNTEEKKRNEQASNAEKILDSLVRFEGMLKPDERGMTQIINEIDNLGKTHKILVGDASYRVVEPTALLDENGNPVAQKASSEKKLEIYPTLGIDTTVVGDYPNLRQFLADLERNRQFLIINSLSFQGGDDKVARQLAKSGKQIQMNSPEALPVSLKIEFDTYFQPPPPPGK